MRATNEPAPDDGASRGGEGVRTESLPAVEYSTAARESEALSCALGYARRGWHVFPCKPDKKPRTMHGFQDATTDEAQIREWWERWPEAVIGVACGPSGLVVVDVDEKNGKNGSETWAHVCGLEPHGAELVAATPSGGRHYVYRAPSGAEITSRNAWRPGIDVKAAGGYVVAPGAEPGREWVEGSPFEGDEPGELPGWLLPQMPQDQPADAPPAAAPAGVSAEQVAENYAEVASALMAVPASIGRDDWLRMIYAAHAALMGDPRGAELVETWSHSTTLPGQYQAGEARRIYQQARDPSTYRPGEPQGIDKGTLFAVARRHGWRDPEPAQPVDDPTDEMDIVQRAEAPSFPKWLLDADNPVARIARWMTASSPRPQPEWSIGTVLPFLAALTGRRVELRANGYTTRPRLMIVNIGGTTAGKSQAAQRMVGAFVDAGLEEYVGPGKWKSEASVRATIHQKPSMVAPVDEFGKFFGGANHARAAAYQMGIGAALLEVFTAGRRLEAAIAANERYTVPATEWPCLSIAGNSTVAGFFGGLAEGSLDDGTLNRFLVVPGRTGHIPRQEVRTDGEDDVVAELRAIDEWVKENAAEFCSARGAGPVAMRASDDVARMLVEIEDEQHKRLHSREAGNVYGRMAELTSMVAVTVAAASRRKEVIAADVKFAVAFVDWSLSYLASEIGLWSGRTPFGLLCNQVEKAVRDLTTGRRATKAAREQGVPARAVARRLPATPPKARTEALTWLVEVGRIRVVGANRANCQLYRHVG